MPQSGQFTSPLGRASFAKERRGEAPRGSTAKLPTAMTMGSGGAGGLGSGGGGAGGSSSSSSASRGGLTDAGYTSSNPDVAARTILLRPVTAQRQATRLRGMSAVRSAVRRVQPRTMGVSTKPTRKQAPPRDAGSRS